MKIDIYTLAQKIVDKTQAKGIDISEAYIIEGKQMSIQIEESSIVKAINKSSTGVGLRALHSKGVGLASSTQFDDISIDGMINDAVTLAKMATPDPAIVGLAEPVENYPEVDGLYDKELANLGSDALVELAITALNASLAKDETINVSGSVNVSIGKLAIVNSNGISVESPRTSIQMFLSNKITKENDEVGVGFEYGFGRTISEINAEKIGKVAAEKAFKMLGSKKIESGNYPFLLSERATRQSIGGIISRGISAYEIDQGTAFFSDRLGDEIANSSLSIIDNPLENGGLSSRAFDDEGTPSQKLTLIKEGVLMTYLSDVYTANKLDIPNTGSASKNGYAGIPRPSLSLIQIQAGDTSNEELLEELGTGLMIESAIFPMAGTNISQQVDIGFWVEKGEIKHPVKNTMLGTTVYDLLMNIKQVGKEQLVESGLKSSMILVDETKFSSGK
ncbi:MAG: TldD/PmbA family protein [Candidatus Kariarchaeaceae archaeon]